MSDDTIGLRPLTQGGKAICPAAFKADTGDSGIYESIVSVFGNIDYVGDVVEHGAYDEDLKAWAASEDQLPVIWSHQWTDPKFHIGYVLEAKELEPGHELLPESIKAYGGLWTSNQLDMDEPTAKKVFRLLKGRRVRQFSFHYDTLEATYGKHQGETVRFLKRLHLNETGPTLLGANDLTNLLAAKASRAGALDLIDACTDLTDEEKAAVRGILTSQATTAPESEPPAQGHADHSRIAGVDDLAIQIALSELG